MLDALRARCYRLAFNLVPAYRGTGGRVTHIAPDWSEIRVALPHSWRTRNYVGTTFGGSMYAAVDPFHVMMLIKRLGDEYVVWDKEAEIRFKRPGRETLYATFTMAEAELEAIRAELAAAGRDAVDRHYTVDLVDAEGTVHATVRKTVHVSIDEETRA